jgi:hypothetical protein
MTDKEAEVSTPDVDKKTITATVDKTKTAQEVELRESLQLLQKTIKDWHHEVDFTSNAVGNCNGASAGNETGNNEGDAEPSLPVFSINCGKVIA